MLQYNLDKLKTENEMLVKTSAHLAHNCTCFIVFFAYFKQTFGMLGVPSYYHLSSVKILKTKNAIVDKMWIGP